MNFLKIIGALLVSCSGVLVAYMLNGGERKALRQLEGVLAFLRFLQINISAYSMPLPEILLRCPREIYTACGYAKSEPPRTVKELFEECSFSDSSLRQSLLAFSSEIGKGYSREQLELLERTAEEIEEKRRRKSTALPSKVKSNAAVCISVSLSVVILLF